MVAYIHDVSVGRAVDPALFSASLERALRFAGTPAARNDRYDADGYIGLADTCEAYARHADRLAVTQLRRDGWEPTPAMLEMARRDDALPAGTPGAPFDFQFMRTQILEEKRQPLTAMQHLAIDSSVPLGAKTHRWTRALGAGEAQIYRGGSEFPRARVTYTSEEFGTAYVVCSVGEDVFDDFSLSWAGIQQYQREFRLAVRLVEERMNRIAWLGHAPSKIYGALNHPALAKVVLATAFTDASNPEDVAAALADFVNTPMIVSNGTFQPNALLVSPRVWAFLTSRPTTLAMNMFIADLFLAGQRGRIQSIEVAPELAGIGPGGRDGILAYRKDLDTMGHVVIQTPTALPVHQSSPVERTTVVFGATGGVVATDIGNAILGYVTVQ